MGEFEEVSLSTESFEFDPSNADTLELDILDLRDQEGVTYPAVLLSNVLFTDCLRILQSVKRTSYRQMPVWVELPDSSGFENIGQLQLDSDVLLLLRHLRICVTLYFDAEHIEVLDLDNPSVIEKFI